MKTTKILLSTLSVATLAFSFACNTTSNVAVSNATTANAAANKANTAVVVNANQAPVTNTATVANAASSPAANSSNANKTAPEIKPAAKDAGDKVSGELQTGKTESVILYVGMESGDYAGYCFANDSEAGRAILAACKDKEQCEIGGTIDYEIKCQVPGLEADLSASGRILKVSSAKSLGRKK